MTHAFAAYNTLLGFGQLEYVLVKNRVLDIGVGAQHVDSSRCNNITSHETRRVHRQRSLFRAPVWFERTRICIMYKLTAL